jgi:hypothetical protein
VLGTQVSDPVVEGRMLNVCGGVPTVIRKVDQLPSSPPQIHAGDRENGAGTALVAAALISSYTCVDLRQVLGG